MAAGRQGRQFETLAKRPGDKLMEQSVTPSTLRHLWVSLGEGSFLHSLVFLSFFSFTLPFCLFQRSVKISFFSPSFISVLFMFSIVSIEGGG